MRRLVLLAIISLAAAVPAAAQSFQSWAAKGDKNKQKDSSAAISAYTQALRLWKKTDGAKSKARVLSERASLYEKNGEPERAVKDLSAALAAQPKTASFLHRRGRLHLELGRAKAAVEDFYKAISVNLDFRDAYHDRARAYERLGDMKFAREDHRTACGLGHKKSCAAAKTLRQAADAAAARKKPGAEDDAAYAAPLEPEGPRVVEVKKASGRPKGRVNFDACISVVDACLEEGDSFGTCVSRAKACEKGAAKGCCPQACLTEYARLSSAQSEAAAYRAVFTPSSPCAKPAP